MPLDGNLKMKNVFSNSVTPSNMKPNHKVYLETKALFNAVKHHGITSYTKKLQAAGIPSQRLSPTHAGLNIPHMNQEVLSKSLNTYNIVSNRDPAGVTANTRNMSPPPQKASTLNGCMQSV